jgi:hypothetical protein
LISPLVLSRVFESNKLEGQFKKHEFLGSFSLRPYTPDRNLILRKYESLAESSDLSQAEYVELQAALDDELQLASSGAAEIYFQPPGILGMSDKFALDILHSVPKFWGEHMVYEAGVLRSEVNIYGPKVLREDMFQDLDYLISFEMLLDKVRLLESNVEVLSELPNGLVVVDAETEFNLPSVERAIHDLRRYRIDPLVNPIKALGIARDPEVVRLYFSNQLIDLKRNYQVTQSKIGNLQDALDSYSNQNSGRRPSSQIGSPGIAGGSVIPQFSSTFLENIVEMSSSGKDMEYRQKLNSRLIDLADVQTELDSEIRRIEEIVSVMQGSSKNTTTAEIRALFADKAKLELPLLLGEVRALFQISERLYASLNSEAFGGVGDLYRIADQGVTRGNVTFLRSETVMVYISFLLFAMITIGGFWFIRQIWANDD